MVRVLRIHGLVIILSLAAGATLAGVIGALLAVPVAAVSWTIFEHCETVPQPAYITRASWAPPTTRAVLCRHQPVGRLLSPPAWLSARQVPAPCTGNTLPFVLARDRSHGADSNC